MVHITIQPIIYHDLIFANLDLESKAGQYPEPISYGSPWYLNLLYENVNMQQW